MCCPVLNWPAPDAWKGGTVLADAVSLSSESLHEEKETAVLFEFLCLAGTSRDLLRSKVWQWNGNGPLSLYVCVGNLEDRQGGALGAQRKR